MNRKLILSALLLSVFADCNAAIGTITQQENTPPSIQRSKTTITGSKGTGVEMQDEVKTARGKAGITFADNTQVQVNENSRLVIDDFVYDPKKGSGQLALNMASGTVRYASGAIAKNNPSKVAINTPTATIAVRGTDFTATVDELGASTIILLPSCPPNWQDIERDCKTGAIDVITDAGIVSLTRPFQATKVETRGVMPTKPVTLNLSLDAINNMLIIAPPRELRPEVTTTKIQVRGALDVDFLKETGLTNALDLQQKEVFKDKLSTNLLNQDFLANILDIINAQVIQRKSSTANAFLARDRIEGSVDQVFPDHSGHRHFSLKIGPGINDHIEVIYNLSFGHLPTPTIGMSAEACGDYITSIAQTGSYPPSPDGGIIHWVHRSPSGHEPGYVILNGIKY